MIFSMLAALTGVISALTVAQNGQLAAFYGDWSAAVLIHFTGLIGVLCWRFFARKQMPEKKPASPWMFLGGVVGIGTTVFINMAYGGVSVTAIGGLGLLGQTISSLFVDHYGLMGAERRPFFKARLWAVAAVTAGAAVMLFPLGNSSLLAILLALASGVTIVCARTINGQLAKRQGALRSTVMNYVTGLLGTTLLMLLFGMKEPIWQGFAWSPNLFMYIGGLCGVGLIMLLNVTVNKVPAFVFTLLQFTGQIFTGLLLDALTDGGFSWQSMAGGVLVALGLCLDHVLSRRHQSTQL